MRIAQQKLLGESLVEKGLISVEQLKEAIEKETLTTTQIKSFVRACWDTGFSVDPEYKEKYICALLYDNSDEFYEHFISLEEMSIEEIKEGIEKNTIPRTLVMELAKRGCRLTFKKTENKEEYICDLFFGLEGAFRKYSMSEHYRFICKSSWNSTSI